jgi:uncharacterized protein YndB with AHSA1/START domain
MTDPRLQEPLAITTPSDREIVITRRFAAPRALVFDAFTKPALILRWLWGPDDWKLVECRLDARPGGALRYVWRHATRGDMGLGGTVREIDPPARIVHTELFDQDWTGGETLVTTEFAEDGAGTLTTMTILYSSRAARDGALGSGMTEGMEQSYRRLDGFLAGQGA